MHFLIDCLLSDLSMLHTIALNNFVAVGSPHPSFSFHQPRKLLAPDHSIYAFDSYLGGFPYFFCQWSYVLILDLIAHFLSCLEVSLFLSPLNVEQHLVQFLVPIMIFCFFLNLKQGLLLVCRPIFFSLSLLLYCRLIEMVDLF